MKVAIYNGHSIDINTPVIDMQDRGYNFGDGVYEVTPFFNGKCFALIPHMERLFYSLKELNIPAVYTLEELVEFHERLIKENDMTDGYIYMQITRGNAIRTHAYPDQVVPCLTMHAHPLDVAQMDADKKVGKTAITQPDIRWLRCDIKSLNLLGATIPKQQAVRAGAGEAILYRENGVVTEGSSSNFMVVKDGVVWTHPKNNYILNGINRRIIMEKLSKELDITIVEKTFDIEFVKNAQEAFITASTYAVMPIISVDKTPIGDGKVGPITQKLIDAFAAFIQAECYGK